MPVKVGVGRDSTFFGYDPPLLRHSGPDGRPGQTVSGPSLALGTRPAAVARMQRPTHPRPPHCPRVWPGPAITRQPHCDNTFCERWAVSTPRGRHRGDRLSYPRSSLPPWCPARVCKHCPVLAARELHGRGWAGLSLTRLVPFLGVRSAAIAALKGSADVAHETVGDDRWIAEGYTRPTTLAPTRMRYHWITIVSHNELELSEYEHMFLRLFVHSCHQHFGSVKLLLRFWRPPGT